MNPQEYARMHALETDYWWFAGRRAIIASLLRVASGDDATRASQHASSPHMSTHAAAQASPGRALRLLDIGCGTGANLPLLLRHVGANGSVVGLDFSPLALRFACDSMVQSSTHATRETDLNGDAISSDAMHEGAMHEGASGARISLLRGDALHLPFAGASFDIVTMLDVLEHLSDDARALSEVSRVLRPGGALVWSVPAYQKLWSAHDEALHHFRRYENRALRRLMRRSGFDVQLLSFAMSLMPPLAWLWRRLVLPFQPRRPRSATRHSEGAVLPQVPPALNRALVAYLALEGRVIARRPLRFGTSLVGIARKK